MTNRDFQKRWALPRKFSLPVATIVFSAAAAAQMLNSIGTTTMPPGAIVLKAGQNIRNIVNASPAPSTFYFTAGTYRAVTFSPRSGDTYVGAPGAILDGSVVLTGW